ncbi:TetR/AcrR family transcriptional regulator [Nocardia stercoris]|uniref:TetR/AcrR family transcriptional regulator n=1 Tax=Nocardia stercoris TaxID=2483361 RepID=A0A3M2LHQ2_9NOCA|nr:TetR/AcrR family transcriptional regulator [Nocardia stercoris]RMI34278.1 TetR/AcrR family transcriptional regulator [Nocardia stercoris]
MSARASSEPVSAGRGTKDAIRDEAIRLFAEKGFEQTSLREVADAVGITKASLYYHYASKLDLLLAVVEPMFDDLAAVVAEAERLPWTPESIRRVLGHQLAALMRHRRTGELLVRDTVAIVNAVGDRYPGKMEFHRRMCGWLAGPDPTDVRILRATAAVEVIGTVLWTRPLLPAADDGMIETVLLQSALGVLEGNS